MSGQSRRDHTCPQPGGLGTPGSVAARWSEKRYVLARRPSPSGFTDGSRAPPPYPTARRRSPWWPPRAATAAWARVRSTAGKACAPPVAHQGKTAPSRRKLTRRRRRRAWVRGPWRRRGRGPPRPGPDPPGLPAAARAVRPARAGERQARRCRAGELLTCPGRPDQPGEVGVGVGEFKWFMERVTPLTGRVIRSVLPVHGRGAPGPVVHVLPAHAAPSARRRVLRPWSPCRMSPVPSAEGAPPYVGSGTPRVTCRHRTRRSARRRRRAE